MKILLIFATFLVAAKAAEMEIESQDIGTGAIDKKIEEFRACMKTGCPEKGIPVLAPFKVKKAPLNVNFGHFVEFNGEFTNATIEGLDRFQHKVKLNLIKLKVDFEFKFPDISAYGDYDTLGRLFKLIPLFGIGKFKQEPKDLLMKGSMKLGRSADSASVYIKPKSFEIHVSVGGWSNDVTGMLLGGDLNNLLNLVMQDLIPSVIKNFEPQVSKIMHDIIEGIYKKTQVPAEFFSFDLDQF